MSSRQALRPITVVRECSLGMPRIADLLSLSSGVYRAVTFVYGWRTFGEQFMRTDTEAGLSRTPGQSSHGNATIYHVRMTACASSTHLRR